MKHTVIPMLAMLMATAGAEQNAFAAKPPTGAEGARAEVQIGLCSPIDQIVHALDLRPRGAPIEVWQFDDSEIALFARGLRLRLRVAADGRSEFTLKVANQECARLDPTLIPPGEGKCEYDLYGTTTAGAVSLVSRLDATSTRKLLAGRVAPAQVLSAAQIRYLREIVGIWPLPHGIRRLGPMQVKTYRTARGRYDVDFSRLPNGAQFAEISAKVPQIDAASTMNAMKADLHRAGVEMCADQSSQAGDKLRALLR